MEEYKRMSLGELFWAFLSLLLAGLIIVALVVMIWGDSDESERSSCEDIGGVYVVVGEEISATSKVKVQLYGCVKSGPE